MRAGNSRAKDPAGEETMADETAAADAEETEEKGEEEVPRRKVNMVVAM